MGMIWGMIEGRRRGQGLWPWELCLLLGTVALVMVACGRGEEPTPTPPTEAATPSSVASNNGATGNEPSDSAIKIVAMGNSLTDGLGVERELAYPAQLEKRLRDDGYEVVVANAGISGETSSGALSRINWVLDKEKPDIVILETGANDGLRGIDPALTAQNMDELVATFVENDVTVVLAGMQMVPNMGADYIEEFRTIFPKAAKAHEAILIPFFLENVAAVRELNQADEIHPTAEGYTVVVETIYPYVVEAVARIAKE